MQLLCVSRHGSEADRALSPSSQPSAAEHHQIVRPRDLASKLKQTLACEWILRAQHLNKVVKYPLFGVLQGHKSAAGLC
eukprot:scaffold1883_cov261-Pinguiococcus_pyrenoidosus.AAC.13